MQVVHARCCGLDVHKRSVVACVLLTLPDGTVERRTSTFGTMTADLLALHDWLGCAEVTHIAMESTGVYWRPVYNLLEGDDRTILLVNPQHMRAVPGRKTDVKDAEWLADLLRHGLLRGSFIPPAPIRALRELTRYRKTLVQQRADEVNRVQKTLEGANVKLAAVATDVLGASGRVMLAALLEVRTTRRRWPSWRGDGCAPSCRSCAARWMAASSPTIGCCWRTNSRTSTSSRRPSPSCKARLRRRCARMRRRSSCCRPSPVSGRWRRWPSSRRLAWTWGGFRRGGTSPPGPGFVRATRRAAASA